MPQDALVMSLEEALPGEGARDAVSLAVLRVRDGDREAFGDLVALAETRVLRLAWHMLGDRDQARDAAQEAFLRAFKSLSHFRLGESFPAWIARITVNVCLDHLRRRGPVPVDLSEAQLPAEAGNPSEALLRKERRHLVRRALDGLTPRERAALVLRDLEGHATDEVARLLGVKAGTVRCQAAQARGKLLASLRGGKP